MPAKVHSRWQGCVLYSLAIEKATLMSEIDQYDYELPRELIAQQPLRHRADARLLVVDRSTESIEHRHVRDLPQLLRPNDIVVLNDTRVIPARLVGYRTSTGGRWGGLFLGVDEQGIWKVMGHTRGKLAPGETITLQDRSMRDVVELTLLAKLDGGAWAARPNAEGDALTLLDQVGRVPLPPYIRGGEMIDEDRDAYQTVFADEPGAVAAPTAGLHLTTELLDSLTQRGITIERITLHVGVGTFRPVSASRLSDHVMHAEWGRLEADVAARITAARADGGRIVAIGTTSVRVLETAAQSGELHAWQGETDLFIRPPFQFRAVDALMTNFHLPKSTLLVLVRTFGGDALIRRAYEQAVADQYRFYSYGDAMLIL